MNEPRPFSLVLTILASCLLAGVGCQRPPARQEIRVGSILDMTGVGASYGKRMKQGFELATANARTSESLKGWTVTPLIEDFQWDTAKALTSYRKLTSVDNVKIIVGITGSKNATPVAEASKKEDVVIIDAVTSSPTLTRQAGPNYFRVMASDAFAGRFNAQWAAQSGAKRPGIMFVEDEWGVSYRDELKKYLGEFGFDRVNEQGAAAGAKDYRPQLARFREAGIDTVFLLLYPGDGGTFMQQLRQNGLPVTVYGSDNLSAPQFTSPGSDIVDGVRLALPATVDGAPYEAFKRQYRERFHEEADTIAAKSYDAMSVAIDAARRAEGNTSAMRRLLKSGTYSFEGLTGRIQFDSNGDLASQQYAKTVYSGGKLVPFVEKAK